MIERKGKNRKERGNNKRTSIGRDASSTTRRERLVERGGTKKKEGRKRERRESEDESRGLRQALREGQKWAKASAMNN